MVLDKLGEALKGTLNKITQSVFVDAKLVDELVKEIQRALLQADVNVNLVFDLSKSIRERALAEDTAPGITKKEHLITVVYEELVKLLGEKEKTIAIEGKPTKIMLVGLFGSGKTTTAGKLAKYYQKRGKRVAMVQLDTWRPAAYEQLHQLAKSIDAPAYGNPGEKDPVKIYEQFEDRYSGADLLIVDTAGRDALSGDLIDELKKINARVAPDETLLVLSADIGQAAETQAQAFHDACDVSGVMITKLDGTAKGGGALSACKISGAPVVFVGLGEKIDDLDRFNPKGFVGRMLGMGDLDALLEKAREAVTEEEADDLGKRFLKGDFNLIDLYEQMQAMKKMGSLNKIVEMIPGLGQLKMPKEALDVQEEKLKDWKILMDSMTKEELENPDLLSSNRIDRISKGSGKSTSSVRELLKQYKQSKKMMKQFKNPKQMDRAMKKLGMDGVDLK